MAVRVRQKNRDEEWNRNMGAARQQQNNDMLAMALKMNDQQAIGYLIGALGKKLWMDHLARRHAREDAENLKEGQLTKGDGAEWTRQDVDWYKRSGGDMQGASPDTVAVVTSQGEVNPRFATPDVEPKVTETSIGYIDPSNNYQVSPLQSPENKYYDLLNQRMNPELSGDALRKVLFGGRYF